MIRSGTRRVPIPHEAVHPRERNRIGRFFDKLKHFRQVATHDDRRFYYMMFLEQDVRSDDRKLL